ncbi:MAG: ABC transporter permease [Gemmatimonadaceae bacterium]|nr:ABC transporter permease [Gemmatimonadaceae bacterium]MDQ3243086.1 ABC transporter permease [Gemmatimonadota bacterium]
MNSDVSLASEIRGFGATRRVLSRGGVTASIALLFVIAAVCALAPLVAPYDPAAQPSIIALRSQPPSWAHPFGTDEFSRDVLSRVIYGGRVSLAVAVVATLVSVTLGTAYGAAAGYATGFGGALLQRVLEALLSIPRLLLLIAIFAAWREIPPAGFVLILGVTGWYGLARLVRGQVLALKTRDFVASARALGATDGRILMRHILPNVVTPVVVAATLGIGHVIVLEAGLSYLGIGVRPPDPSWGNMIHDGPEQIAAQWWVSVFPGIAIVCTVMAFNVLGDALLRALRPGQTETG